MKTRILSLTLLLTSSIGIPLDGLAEDSPNPAEGADKISYVPEFHGAIRPRWELDTETGESRFEVRWARFTGEGKVSPKIGYFFQLDLCDQGVFKFHDAYVKMEVAKGLEIQAGQFRMPFGREPFMAPQNYVFANRSFMGKQMCNYRKVGAKVTYTAPTRLPLTIEAAVGNAGGVSNHNTWSKSYMGSGRISLQAGDFNICGGIMDILPDVTRIMLYDIGTTWKTGNWRGGLELMNEHYVASQHKDAQSWVLWGDYGRPAKLGIFNRWSVQARYDGMTRQWSGVEGAEDNPARNRITVGGTLTYRYKKVFADLMLDYEQYFYHRGITPSQGQGNK
ncbi:MAG: porin, partial [Muribaculaceae bacterium]|nr:porin [Muribaculaceae bacterium]